MFRLMVQGIPTEEPIQHFEDPVALETAYLHLCTSARTDGPGSVKIPSGPVGVVPPAYFRLDRDWAAGIPREQEPGRLGLWTDTAEGYQVPTPFQLRAAARVLGESGEGIARALGITGRLWRYYLAEDRERREMPWATWRVIRLWLEGVQH